MSKSRRSHEVAPTRPRSRRGRRLDRAACALVVGAAVAALGFTASEAVAPSPSATAPSGAIHRPSDEERRPNIVFVLTDDMRADELRYLPNIRRLLVDRGVTYTHAISPHPLCCPARASLVTGQYAQNNGVRHNQGPWGGYAALRAPRNTIGRWLHRAGYRTGYHGKYLNLFHEDGSRPPGWDVWQPQLQGMYAYGKRPAKFAGGIVFRDTYPTDGMNQLTRRSIRGALRTGRPFFEWINHTAPHPLVLYPDTVQQHPVYERRHAEAYADVLPPVIREGEFPGSKAERRFLVEHTRARLRALRSVDDAVARTVRQLRRAGELDETYFVFTSDNGYQLGEHGILGKNTLYEGSLRVPLVVRGPGIEPGTRDHTPVSLLDLVPTILNWADARPGRRLDGVPLSEVVTERDTVLIQTGDARKDASPGWAWRGVRTADYVFAAPPGRPSAGFLYDLAADPRQRTNLIRRDAYRDVRRELVRRTKALVNCAGSDCNRVFGPLPR